jgi:HK97 family phage portal protein
MWNFKAIFGGKGRTEEAPIETRSATGTVPIREADILTLGLGMAQPNDSGQLVSPETAMRSSAVNACVTRIAFDLGLLDFNVLCRSASGRIKQFDHPVWRLLHDAPNCDMTSQTWREQIAFSVLLYGNSYSYIDRDEGYRPIAVYPLQSLNTRPHRIGGHLCYRTTLGTGAQVDLLPEDVVHIRGLTRDGVLGVGIIEWAAQQIGQSIASTKTCAAFYRQGMRPSGYLVVPNKLDRDQRKHLRLKMAWNTSPSASHQNKPSGSNRRSSASQTSAGFSHSRRK